MDSYGDLGIPHFRKSTYVFKGPMEQMTHKISFFQYLRIPREHCQPIVIKNRHHNNH